MTKYGQVALLAVKHVDQGLRADEAWRLAAATVFLNGSDTSKRKSCPKSAFLHLVDAGLVVGAEPAGYSRSPDDKRYAPRAVALLRKCPDLANKPAQLWKSLMAGATNAHNDRMSVVVALWHEHYIRR